jgi:hypothetical protein
MNAGMTAGGRLWTILWLVATVVATSRPAHAQEFAPQLTRVASDSRGFVSTGWDPTFVLDGGAEHTVWRPTRRSALTLGGALRLPLVLIPEFDSFGLAAGPSFTSVTKSGVGVRTALFASLRTASDATGTKVGARLTPELSAGYFARSWSASVVASMTTTFATYMHHSDAVRDLFRDRYPPGQAPSNAIDGPKDGLYALTGQQYRLGAAGGLQLSKLVGLYLVAGYVQTPQVEEVGVNPPIGPLPFYMQLGGDLRW